MAAPTITWKVYNSGTTTWYDISTDTLKFTGTGGVGDPVTAPTSGYMVANQLWLDASTDRQVTEYEGGGATASYGSAPSWSLTNTNYVQIAVTTNPETSPGELTAWDTTSHAATSKEILAGTTNMAHSWLRAGEAASDATADSLTGTLATNYDTQTDATTDFQLQGSTYGITFSSACSAGNSNYFTFHCFVPDDAAAGTTGHDPVLTYTYYYT